MSISLEQHAKLCPAKKLSECTSCSNTFFFDHHDCWICTTCTNKLKKTAEEDWTKYFRNAEQWFIDHKEHVRNLLRFTGATVKPSGSDLHHPKLWKPIHWNWFFKYQHLFYNSK